MITCPHMLRLDMSLVMAISTTSATREGALRGAERSWKWMGIKSNPASNLEEGKQEARFLLKVLPQVGIDLAPSRNLVINCIQKGKNG